MTDAQVTRFDHVGIAVRDLRGAVHLFHEVLGGEYLAGGEDLGLGIMTIQFRFASGGKVELMTPTREDSYLARYLEKHGPGFHHAAMMVEDLQAAIVHLESEGYEVVDVEFARPDWYEAFLRPRSAHGTLVQLVQTTRDWSDFRTELTLEQVLAGEVVWDEDSRPRLREEVSA